MVLQVRNETRPVHVAYAGAPEESVALLVILGLIGLVAITVGLWPRRRDPST